MPCLLIDVDAGIQEGFGMIRAYPFASRLFLYADDTLIIEANCEVAEVYLNGIREMGAFYSLWWDNSKLEY